MHLNRPPVESVIAAIREAASLVLSLQDDIVRQPEKRHIKPDGSFATHADMKSLEAIARRLRALTPTLPIVAQEQPADVNRTILEQGGMFWLVDSLDNARDYALGGANFSINLALIDENGESVLGVLCFPKLNELYYTGDDGKAYRQSGESAPVALQVMPFASTDISPPPIFLAPVQENNAFAQRPLRIIGTRGQRRACLVASGEAVMCAENEGFFIWDTAPVAALLTHAGGGVFNLEDGEPLRFNRGLRLPAYAVCASHAMVTRMELFGFTGPVAPPALAEAEQE